MTTTSTAALAAIFRAERGRASMTQTELANRTGIPQVSISRKLKGDAPITVDEAISIMDALGLDPATTWAQVIESAAPDTQERYGLVAHDPGTSPEDEQEQTEENHP